MSTNAPPRFMFSASFIDSDVCDELLDDPQGGEAAAWGLVVLLSRLKLRDRNESAEPGTFGSERALRDALGVYARFIPLYRRLGVIDGLTATHWAWQTNYDPGSRRRQADKRERERRNGSGNGSGNGSSRALNVNVNVERELERSSSRESESPSKAQPRRINGHDDPLKGGTTAPPTEGDCRICGGHLSDKEPCRVGPGWIEHAEHPGEWTA